MPVTELLGKLIDLGIILALSLSIILFSLKEVCKRKIPPGIIAALFMTAIITYFVSRYIKLFFDIQV